MPFDGRRTLVVAAHPDDEVLGCGATVARLAALGAEIYIGILGEGITSREGTPEARRDDLLAALHATTRRVGDLLGAMDVLMESLPDNRFDQVPLLDVVKRVERWIEGLQPEVVYTHHPGDLNIDHAITFRAVLTATRPTSACPVRELRAFEVPSATEWAFQSLAPAFRANLFSDVSMTIERKIAAMELYESERRSFPHPRSPEALRAIARRWGSVIGVEFAEAFEVIRSIG